MSVLAVVIPLLQLRRANWFFPNIVTLPGKYMLNLSILADNHETFTRCTIVVSLTRLHKTAMVCSLEKFSSI